jgi:hypothetical protein
MIKNILHLSAISYSYVQESLHKSATTEAG